MNELLKNNNMSLTRSILILINFIFSMISGYKKIAGYLIARFGSDIKGIDIKIKFILYIIIIFINLVLAYPMIREGVKNFKKECFNDLISVIFITSLCCLLVVLIFSGLNIKVSSNQLRIEKNFENIFYGIFVALIYAPIVEEIVFRGVIYPLIKNKYGDVKAIIISSFLFGFLHIINSLSSFSFNEITYFIIYSILGAGFCFSYKYANSVLGSMINHFIWNLLTLIPMVIKIILII